MRRASATPSDKTEKKKSHHHRVTIETGGDDPLLSVENGGSNGLHHVNGGGGGGGDDPITTPSSLLLTSTTTTASTKSSTMNGRHHNKALPGRPKRKRTGGSSKHKRGKSSSSFCYRFYVRWIKGGATTTTSSFNSVYLAVLLWYCLGVISIGTSKLLLMNHESDQDPFFGGVPPLFLTLQQQVIGSILLRFLLQIRFLDSSGLQSWPTRGSIDAATARSRRPAYAGMNHLKKDESSSGRRLFSRLGESIELIASIQPSLVAAGIFFCLGFLATNHGFFASSASFVETIKASEPITSAMVAVWWGIEFLSYKECVSLGTIVAGVILSTVGNSAGHHHHHAPFVESARACFIVMASNLCFSFRGLYQKLFRATPEGSAQVVDDLNLQYRMQQIGTFILLIPALIWDMPKIIRHIILVSTQGGGLFHSGLLWRYLGIALLNGVAFTSYNLASTYVLSRITVVHHAALNCVRRMFAIVVTSILFSVPITLLGALGVLVSFGGFMAFTHYKIQRQRQPKPLSSLLPVSVVN